MKNLLFLILYISFLPNSFGAFQKIWKGYQVSTLNQSKLIAEKINEADFLLNDNQNDWTFNINPSQNVSNPASLFSFQSQQTETSNLAFGLSKSSYRFGTFSIMHTKIEYDLSKWNPSILNSNQLSNTLFENKTAVNYSYDFLDRSRDRDYEFIKAQKSANTIANQIEVEKAYLSFFTTYLQAKFQLFAMKLNRSFVKEASKRVEQTKKRTKDGVSRKIDLFQARTSLLNQKESLEMSKSNFKENLSIIENIVKRKIEEKFFDKIYWKKKKFNEWNTYITKSNHQSIELIKEQIKASEASLNKLEDQNGMKLLLNAGIESNAISSDRDESFEEHLKTRSKRVGVGLNLIIPLGLDKRKGLRSKVILEKKKNELNLINTQDEIEVKKKALLAQISYSEQIISYSSSKVSLAQKTLKEQNRLYLRGQASFEEVIRAQETYINTRLNEKRTLLEYELLIANYAYLNNSIKSFLNAYRD